MTPQDSVESTPLLSAGREVCNPPRDQQQRALQSALNNCARTPGSPPAVPRNSPALLQYLKRKLGATPPEAPEGKPKTGLESLPPRTRRVVHAVYAIAILCCVIMMCVSPSLLLYLRHVGFAGRGDLQFYVNLTVIFAAVPVLTHILLSRLADVFGAPRALTGGAFVVAAGLCGMAVVDDSRLTFALAYVAFSAVQSIKPVRTIVLSDITTDATQAEVMSYHALMTPVGALFGPLAWLVIENYKGDWRVGGGLRVNRFSLDYYFAAGLALVIAGIATFFLPRDTKDWLESSVEDDVEGGVEVEQTSRGQHATPEVEFRCPSSDLQALDLRLLLHHHVLFQHDYGLVFDSFYLSILIIDPSERPAWPRSLCYVEKKPTPNVSYFEVSFQPIMVMEGADGRSLGLIYEALSFVALIPPVLVAYLSKRLQDRQILLIGLTAKMIGVLLFMPLFPAETTHERVPSWAVVAGFMILVKASVFFYTAALSLFTKLLGRGAMLSGILIGVLSSVAALGPAVAQLVFAEPMMAHFGTWTFGIFVIPVVVSTGLVLWYWARLGSDLEFYRLVLAEYSRRIARAS